MSVGTELFNLAHKLVDLYATKAVRLFHHVFYFVCLLPDSYTEVIELTMEALYVHVQQASLSCFITE